MAQKPSIPKGTRDFSPEEMAKRNYIFDTIKEVFTLHGFRQIETPSMENLSTLMGKYGEEGDKLLFKILNSGDFLKGVTDEQLTERNCPRLTSALCEKGLRYDLTVPFARYVVQHRNELQFPFKRFQIQPVWRADRPQKGRYREFYQCDADVIGTDSLLNEIDLLEIIDEVFRRFGISITIKLNNRKVLSGIAEIIGEPEKIVDITVAIDKIDKIGIENVNAELLEKGIKESLTRPFTTVLSSLGVADIGKKSAELLVRNGFDSIDKILDAADRGDPDSFASIPGFGEITGKRIVEAFSSDRLRATIEALRKAGLHMDSSLDREENAEEQTFSGQVWCITGSFKNFNPRTKALKEIEKRGGRTVSSVTSKTTHLLAGEGGGSKRAEAERLGVKIVSEDEFMTLLGGAKKKEESDDGQLLLF